MTAAGGAGEGAGAVAPGAVASGSQAPGSWAPGEVLHGEGDIGLNAGRPVTRLVAVNAADRPVQVGSHYHFAEANPGLEFDRPAAYGLRLNIPAGTAVRFEPGIPVEVELIPVGGRREIAGLRGETGGPLDG